MNEYENSYVFSESDALDLLKKLKVNFETEIDDYYLDKETRVRHCADVYHLTQKSGDKVSGCRQEIEEVISQRIAKMLIPKSNLHIHKKRFDLHVPKNCSDYKFTLDLIDQPMKLAVFEIESNKELCQETLINIFLKTGQTFKKCPKSAWDLFRRKIGICGAPSSGKSETSKWLSNQINTKLSGNSFHVVEFATSFIQKYGRTPKFHDQFFIWHGQKSREENASSANVVISDCPTFLTYIYMQLLNTEAISEQSALYLSKVYKRVLFDILNYTDIIFLQLLDYKDNNIRYQTKDEALNIQTRIDSFLKDHGVRHSTYTYEQASEILDDLFFINKIDNV